MTAVAYDESLVASKPALPIDGGMQFWSGLSFGSASLVNWLVLSGQLTISPAFIGMAYMAATCVFLTMGVAFKVGTDRAMLQDAGYRRFRAVWGSLIIGAMFVIGALAIMLTRLHMAADIAFVISPVALCVYGIGWRVAAVMSGQRWPNFLSLGSFVAALYLATLAGTPQQSLAYTLCLITLAVIPGLLLLLRRTHA